MRALTLTQPWATLVAIGAKKIETRGWLTTYRGPLAIHAAKGWTRDDRDLCDAQPFARALGGVPLPLGFIVAVGTLADCVRIGLASNGDALLLTEPVRRLSDHSEEYQFGNYEPGRYAWLLSDVKRLPVLIPCRGALGLWTPPEIIGAVEPTR